MDQSLEKGDNRLQVHIFQLQLLQTGINCFRNIVDFGYNFRNNIKLLSRDTTLLDRRPKLGFCVVDLGTVEMIVAELDSGLNSLNRSTINAAST